MRSRTLARAALLGVSGALSLVGLELGLRVVFPGSAELLDLSAFSRVSHRPGQMTELIPGAQNPHFMGHDVTINAHGFRGAPFDLPKSPTVTRVLAVGDSVTFGYGVSASGTFHQLGKPADTEVINMGLPGAGLPYMFHTVSTWCAATSADAVLLNVVLNDIAEYAPDVLSEAPLRRARGPADPAGWGLGGSYAYTLGMQQIKSALYRVGYLNIADSPGYRFVTLETDADAVARAWQSSLEILDATVREVRACGATPIVTVFPLEVQLSTDALAVYREGLGVPLAETATDLAPQRVLRAWAERAGVALVDFTATFAEHPPERLYLRDMFVTLDPVHPSALGHELAGRALAPVLSEHLAAR